MENLISFIVFCQVLGAFIGAFATIWGEIAYLGATHDGDIDAAERAHMRSVALGLRFGMTLLLSSSLALVVIAYVTRVATQPALTTSYWTLIGSALLVIYTSWALSRRHISFKLGSAIAFTTWWFLAYLTLGWVPPLSFGATIAFLVIATAVFYAILQYARMLAHRPKYENSQE